MMRNIRIGAVFPQKEIGSDPFLIKNFTQEVTRTASQVSINWVRQQQPRAMIIPILGERNPEQLEDNMACLEWELNEEHLQKLDKAIQSSYDIPLDWLSGAGNVIYGKTLEKIDTHKPFPLR